MKKVYLAPATFAVAIQTIMVLAGSGEGVQSDNGIDYGGADVDGDKEPGARRWHNVWDE